MGSISPIPTRTDFLLRDAQGGLTGKVSWPWLKWLQQALSSRVVAEAEVIAHAAAIAATTLLAVPISGLYRVSFAAKVTQAATTSCVLGGTNGFQIVYTDKDDSVVVTTPAGIPFGSTAALLAVNTAQNQQSGEVLVWAKVSTDLQYLFDYTSVGATPMQYSLHIKVERL